MYGRKNAGIGVNIRFCKFLLMKYIRPNTEGIHLSTLAVSGFNGDLVCWPKRSHKDFLDLSTPRELQERDKLSAARTIVTSRSKRRKGAVSTASSRTYLRLPRFAFY